ncbi:hypothetical protein ACO02O_01063 [Dirofilaria immitis]
MQEEEEVKEEEVEGEEEGEENEEEEKEEVKEEEEEEGRRWNYQGGEENVKEAGGGRKVEYINRGQVGMGYV